MIDLDDLIQTWQQRLQAITVNANELSEAEGTRRIRICLREGSYRGLTQQRAQQAVDQLSRLVDDYLLLARVVEQAELANHVGLFGSRDDADARIMALLQGPSIERAQNHVPLAQRALLGAALEQSQLTPQQLLECMQHDFVQARDTLCAIDRAQTEGQAALSALRQDFARVQERAARLQPDADQPPMIDLQDLQADPLNAELGMASMRRGLKAWVESLDAVEHNAMLARAAVAQAHGALDALQQLDVDLKRLRTDLEPLLGVRLVMPQEPDTASLLGLLNSWCGTLDASLQAGQWAAVSVGAKRLQMALAQATDALRKALAQLRCQRDALDELSGQFMALRAKEQALRGQGPTNGALSALRNQIADALHHRPLQPDAVGALLRQYRELLASSSRL